MPFPSASWRAHAIETIIGPACFPVDAAQPVSSSTRLMLDVRQIHNGDAVFPSRSQLV
jgi:hypothetical protein